MPATQPLIRSLLAAAAVVAPLVASQPAVAQTPVSELKDVQRTHWAYNAIQALVDKYKIAEGFPDGTFRGNRTLTRYELAAALAKVMARMEELIGASTGAPLTAGPGVEAGDLRTVARLQREFRDELEILKGRVDTLDTRVETIEKRLKLTGEMRGEYRDFLGASPLAGAPLAELRLRNRINLEASLLDDLSYRGSLFWDVYGPRALGNAFATDLPTTLGATEMYIPRSYAAYTPGWLSAYAGLLNASEVLTLGSTLASPFDDNVWREGTGGYGFVGTPGLLDPSGAIARVGSGATTNAVWWLPGTDVVTQALDPNATQAIFPRGNFTAAADADAGPFNLGVSVYQGGVAGRDLGRLATLGYPLGLPQPETPTQPARLLAALSGDFGTVRGQLAVKALQGGLFNAGAFDKTVTGSVDVGSDALGLSLQAVSRTALAGSFTPQTASAQLASNDLFGTGFGLGFGAVFGSLLDTSLATGQFVSPTGRSLLQGLAGTDFGSYGLTVRIPGFSILPSFTFAAQQTAGAGFGSTIASGLTLQSQLQLFGLPRMQLEYSFGKFDPGADNSLLGGAPLSHEQLTAQMVLPF